MLDEFYMREWFYGPLVGKLFEIIIKGLRPNLQETWGVS